MQSETGTEEQFSITPKGRAYVALMTYIEPSWRLEAVNALWAEIGGIVDSQKDLLAACKAALEDRFGSDDPCVDADPITNQLRAAIAKAEGGGK